MVGGASVVVTVVVGGGASVVVVVVVIRPGGISNATPLQESAKHRCLNV